VSETITLRLPPKTAKNLKEIAKKEGKDRSTLIRELLENGVRQKKHRASFRAIPNRAGDRVESLPTSRHFTLGLLQDARRARHTNSVF